MNFCKPMFIAFLAGTSAISCANQQSNTSGNTSNADTMTTREAAIKEDSVTYTDGSTTLKGYIAYNENLEGKRPVVLVVPEWWGLNDYPRMRAKLLAEMGYLAMAVDMFGNGNLAANPQEAQKMTAPFYQNPQLSKSRIDAALSKIKTDPRADTSKIAAIGYCFGGSVVLNAAKLGANLNGVVSFHGGLAGAPAKKDLLKAKILVCHGAADSFVPQKDVEAFEKDLKSVGADYTIKQYQGATHAFTNPAANETGKKFNLPIAYNAAADSASWQDMKVFLTRVLGQ